MAQSTPCKEGAIPLFCGAACCYIPRKHVLEDEVENIGRNFVTNEEGDYYLRNNPVTGACVFLDTERSQCRIYDRRPQTCREYHCRKDLRVDSIVARLDSKEGNHKSAKSILAELLATAKAAFPDIEPYEALELLRPGIYLSG